MRMGAACRHCHSVSGLQAGEQGSAPPRAWGTLSAMLPAAAPSYVAAALLPSCRAVRFGVRAFVAATELAAGCQPPLLQSCVFLLPIRLCCITSVDAGAHVVRGSTPASCGPPTSKVAVALANAACANAGSLLTVQHQKLRVTALQGAVASGWRRTMTVRVGRRLVWWMLSQYLGVTSLSSFLGTTMLWSPA